MTMRNSKNLGRINSSSVVGARSAEAVLRPRRAVLDHHVGVPQLGGVEAAADVGPGVD